MRIILALTFLAHFSIGMTPADRIINQDQCLCIASSVVQKYCAKEKSSTVATEAKKSQEDVARREIQRLIDESIEADIAKDSAAKSKNETDDFTIKDLDGKVFRNETASKLGASHDNYAGILKISDDTRSTIECLTLRNREATVYVNQHFVRYLPDRKDQSPHEVITNVVHRETWIFTADGWKVKYIEELEGSDMYLDGKVFR